MSKLFVKSLIFPHLCAITWILIDDKDVLPYFHISLPYFHISLPYFHISLPYFIFHCHIFIFHCHIFIFHVSKYSPLCHNSTPRRRQRCIAIERARPAQPLPLFGSGRWGFQDLNFSDFNILKWSLRFSRLKL